MDKTEKMNLILQRVGDYKRSGSGFRCRCPNTKAHAHKDNSYSCYISYGTKGQDITMFCHVCGQDGLPDMLSALGIDERFLCADDDEIQKGDYVQAAIAYYTGKGLKHVASYDYDPDGVYHDGLQKLRFVDADGKKTFRWIRKDETKKDGWSAGRGDCVNRLYTRGDKNADFALILEGEKDVDSCFSATGFLCVSAENGAVKGSAGRKWLPEYSEALKDKTVYIVPDADTAGRSFAETIKRQLQDVAKNVFICDLASVWQEIPEKGDFSDMLSDLGADEAVKRLQTLIATAGQADEKKPDVLSLVPMSQIEEKSARWCVPGYIPEGCISVLGGSGGIGKTSVVCQLVASVTTGKPCSIFAEGIKKEGLDYPETEPGTCVFLTAEDDLGITLRKRLRLAGADLDRVFSMNLGDDRFKMLKINTDFMDAVMDRYRPTVLIVDPLQGFLAEEVRMESRNMMRTALASVAKYGEKFGTTVIIIAHSNKRSESAGRQRLADSADLWDCARCVIMGGNTAIPGQFYLSVEKQNYGKILSTVLYKIDNSGIQFDGLSDLHDYDFATMKRKSRCKGSPQAEDAETLIEMFLKSGESKEIKDLDDYLAEHGVAFGTAQRAKAHLKQKGNISRFCTGAKDNRKWFIRWIGDSVAGNNDDDENLDFVDMDEDELFT